MSGIYSVFKSTRSFYCLQGTSWPVCAFIFSCRKAFTVFITSRGSVVDNCLGQTLRDPVASAFWGSQLILSKPDERVTRRVDHFPIPPSHQFYWAAGAGQLSCLCVVVSRDESNSQSMNPVTWVLIFAMNHSVSWQNTRGHPALVFTLIDERSCSACSRSWTAQCSCLSSVKNMLRLKQQVHKLPHKNALSSVRKLVKK